MTATAPARPIRRRLSPLALVEALATPHSLDRYLELVNPMLTVREIRAQVTDVRRDPDDTVTLTLRPTRQWRGFRAGQFVRITVEIDGVRLTRCYSPACSQYRADGHIEISVKAHPEGVVSRYLHASAAPGMVLGLSQADGTFQLPEQRPRRIVFISGGSGITPVLSMVRTLCDEGYRGQVTFLHYGDTADDIAYRDELRSLAARHANLRLALAHTRQRDGADLHGYFGPEHLEAVAPWHAEAETYLCGPPGLTKAVRALYDERGLTDRLHFEDFAPAAIPVDAAACGDVTYQRSAIVAANSGATLLEQAEAAGLTPEHGCRMGICFSCTKIKTTGCTRNIRTGETDANPDTEIQLCISVPVGDVALDL